MISSMAKGEHLRSGFLRCLTLGLSFFSSVRGIIFTFAFSTGSRRKLSVASYADS